VPLSDEEWNRILVFLQVKAQEAGVDPSNPEYARWMLFLMKENWDLITDEAGMQAAIDAAEIASLRAQKAAVQETLDAMDARIAELEG